MSILSRIFGSHTNGAHVEPSRDEKCFDKAMVESDTLLRSMQAESQSKDVARAVMATFWLHRHNAPFVTTVYESVAEASAALEQRPEDLKS